MKKIVFFLIIFFLTLSSTSAEWYGGSLYNGVLNGYHTVSFGSDTGVTGCPNDGQGTNGARVHPSYTNINAPNSGTMRCQWWDSEDPSSSTDNNSQTWTNGDIYVTVNGRDNGGSGLDNFSYSTLGATLNSRSLNPSGNTHSQTIQYTAEGSHSLRVDMTDEVGQYERDDYGPYQIDKTIPSAPSIGSSSHPNNAWGNDPIITINVNENGEGPAPHQNQYCISLGTCTPGTNLGTSVSITRPDGVYNIFGRTTEPAIGSHISPVSSSIVRIDTGLPTNSANPPDRTSWGPNSTLSINLTSSDVNKDGVQSGLDFSRYIVNQNASHNFGSSCSGGTSFTASTNYQNFAEGTNYIHVCTQDIAGNIFSQTFGEYLVDDTPPVITDSFANNGVWQNTNQTVSLRSTDAHSGTRFIRYTCAGVGCPAASGTIGGGAIGQNVVDASLTFTANTVDAILTYESEDWAGNISLSGTTNVKMDKVDPTPGSLTYFDGWENNTNVGNRILTFSITDPTVPTASGVGIIEVWREDADTGGGFSRVATLNGGGVTNPTRNWTQAFDEGKSYRYEVRYYDIAGNQGTTLASSSVLRMDSIAPTRTISYTYTSAWINTNQTVSFTATDEYSGMDTHLFTEVAFGANCPNPVGGATTPTSINYPTSGSVANLRVCHQARDVATNLSLPQFQDVRVDLIPPSATINYYNGWDNNDGSVSRAISYTVSDNIGGSGIEDWALERGSCPVTGACNPGSWSPVGGIHRGTGIDSFNIGNTYTQPFSTSNSFKYRIRVIDEAGSETIVENPNILRMDNVPPSPDVTYTGVSGTWYNNLQTITFGGGGSDDYSGVSLAKYCEVDFGSSCDPTNGLDFPGSRNYPPDRERSVFVIVEDVAGNSSGIQQFDALVEDNDPDGTLTYHNGWENDDNPTDRRITYTADGEIAGIESNLRIVRLERASCNSSPTCTPTGFAPIVTNNNVNASTFSRTVAQGFVDDISYSYQVYIEDWAGNSTIITSTDVLRLDRTDPSTGATYTGISGTWYNTTQRITFAGATDNYSGVAFARYCDVVYGTTCNPLDINAPIFPSFIDYPANIDRSVSIVALDNAENSSGIQQFDVRVEDDIPTSLLSYLNGRDNNTITNNRVVLYANNDSGGSLLETVTLQRRSADTNNDGTIGAFGGWTTVVFDGPLEQANFGGAYNQPFVNGTAVQFQVLLTDEAGNVNTVPSTDIMRMDNVIPTVTDDYAYDDIWINTTQTFDFTIFDDDSGVINNPVSRRYCIGAVGNTCTPATYLPNSLTFNPDTEQTIRYQVIDRATNESIIGSVNVLIEDNNPDGTLTYHNGWDNSPNGSGNTSANSIANRTIRFTASDTSTAIESDLKTLTLQRGNCPLTGACNPGAWTTVRTENMDQATYNSNAAPYIEPFLTGNSYKYQLLIEDWAGNTNIVSSNFILRLDNVDPTSGISYSGTSGVWYNTTQTITFSAAGASDDYSGVAFARYCEVAYGSTCDPYDPNVGTDLSTSISYPPDVERSVFTITIDNAGNSTGIQQIDVFVEDNRPTGTLTYRDGWDNGGKWGVTTAESIANRTISYDANDTGGSMLENVTLQRQTTTTNNAGGIDAWPTGAASWIDVPGHENAGIETNDVDRTYEQPFDNGTAVRFRLVVNDEATNDVLPAGIITSPDVIKMDNVDPDVTDNYVADGIWINTERTIGFTFTDNDSGIVNALSDAAQNGSGRRYCIGAFGNTCTPNTYLPNSLTFSPTAVGPGGANSASPTPFDWQHTLRYTSTDRAGNDRTATGSIDIFIEDEMPTGVARYYNGWRDDSINPIPIVYAAADTGGSQLERVTLERRTTTTNNNGTINSFIGGWSAVSDNNGLDTNNFPGGYNQAFANRTAAQFRVRLEDEAGNIRYGYMINGAPEIGTVVYETNPNTVPNGTNILRMENEDASAVITNLDSNISPNGWTNVTAQSIEIDFTDTGGSFLNTYTLQISDVFDNSATPTFPNLGNASTWSNIPGYVNRAISGETDTSTYTFTGVNKHAYMFRVMVTDIAGNTSIWIDSTDSPIKIDTDVPNASDISSASDEHLMATSVQNFIIDFDNNGGSPIIEGNGVFEDWSTVNTFLTNTNSSINDLNSTVANQLSTNHSIQDVDRDREPDPAGYRLYSYEITYIEDEAGNSTALGFSESYDYKVFANSILTDPGKKTYEVKPATVANVTSTNNIADGTSDTLTARVLDQYGNGFVRADEIGREINFNFQAGSGSGNTDLYLNQYNRGVGNRSLEMQTSNMTNWLDPLSPAFTNNYLTDLDINGVSGEYDFDFRAFTPTENAYASTTSVSDPGAEFIIQTFQFAVQHNPPHPTWDTGDQSLNNGALIDFVYSPLFTTAISGDIETFGFIEGANQDSDIQVQKANSSVDPNVKSLILEFGVGNRESSPLLGLEVFNPDMQIPEGFSTPTPQTYEAFSLPNANDSTIFDIDSLLTMERGTTLDEIQNSYLSTHIRYTLDGKDIIYNGDVMGKENYFGGQTGGNTIQSGLKVLGQTHSTNQKDIIIDQDGKDLRVLGDIYKASLKKDIVKNAFTIIRNAESNWTFGGTDSQITDLRSFAPGVNDGKSLFNDSIIYFGDDGTNTRVDINPSGNTNARISGKKTILVYGRDIYIEENIYYNNTDEDILGIIALTDEDGNGGNVYIHPRVTNMVGTIFAEKSVISFDGTNELGGGTDQETLKNQLHIFGSVFSENTIGGSRSIQLACPYYVLDSDCDQDTAQKYDMNYLRRFFTYRNGTFIVPANDGRVIGGGTCDNLGVCTGGNINYARYISNTDPAIDSDSAKYVVHPVVIEYNPTGQTDPAPLFEAQ